MSLHAFVEKVEIGVGKEELLGHFIGNISRVEAIRDEFSEATGFESLTLPSASHFTTWLNDQYGLIAFTIRNGAHCGDSIPFTYLPRFKRELLSMPRGGDRLEYFRAQMLELCEVAIRNNLPIRF